jgi:acyl dehydratase
MSERTFTARHDRYGRAYEDLEPGDIYRHWPGKTVTEGEHHLFCALTMSASPLHVDAAFAAELPGGKNVVVGTFVHALLVGMSLVDVTGRAVAALGIDELRYLAPVYHGDTLYAETRILSKRPSRSRPALGVVTAVTRGFNQDNVTVCRFRRSFLVPLADGD